MSDIENEILAPVMFGGGYFNTDALTYPPDAMAPGSQHKELPVATKTPKDKTDYREPFAFRIKWNYLNTDRRPKCFVLPFFLLYRFRFSLTFIEIEVYRIMRRSFRFGKCSGDHADVFYLRKLPSFRHFLLSCYCAHVRIPISIIHKPTLAR